MSHPASNLAPSVEPSTRMGEIEQVCADLSDVREHALQLEGKARQVELRLLGPTPSDEDGSPATAAEVPCVTGVLGETSREINGHLHAIGKSLDRIIQELGGIGREGAPV